MSKRKTIDALFKKIDVSKSKIRILVAVETNVNTSMPHDSGSRKQICEFSINKQDEIRVYLKKGPYQPKYIDCLYNDNNHRRRKSAPHVKNHGYNPIHSLGNNFNYNF